MPLSATDVAALDGNAEALGVPVRTLMTNAGRVVADEVTRRWPEGEVLVVIGKGNNGGDGSVCARILAERGRKVRLLLAQPRDEIGDGLPDWALEVAEETGVPVVDYAESTLEDQLDQSDIVVDAMLGVGVKGSLRAPLDRIVAALNDHEVPVVAVDLPTGHDGPDPVFAAVTVTMHGRKQGMREDRCGEIVVADIGIPDDAERYVGPGDVRARYPRTAASSRKGKGRRMLIVAGGPYTGAPTMCALGAFATGVDLVHMVLPERAARVAEANLIEAIVHPVRGDRFTPAHLGIVQSLLSKVDVVLIGPGLGDAPETLDAARLTIAAATAAGKPLVIDGDGLRALSGDEDAKRLDVVLTPHGGEFKRLTDIDVSERDSDGRIAVASDWLDDGRAVILLKGPEDVIVSAERAVRNRTHHPAMTTGGTGDVLAGVVAALRARGLDAFDAARVGAYLNGAAGIQSVVAGGPGLRATDLVVGIRNVLKANVPP